MHTSIVALSIGSNIGDRERFVADATDLISNIDGVLNLISSSKYESDAWGFSSDKFLNSAVVFETAVDRYQLLEMLQQIENRLGRVRSGDGYSARTVDIDIIFYGDQISSDPTLTLPHPLFRERRFVLVPLAEIMGDFIDPETNKSVDNLLITSVDNSKVTLLNS